MSTDIRLKKEFVELLHRNKRKELSELQSDASHWIEEIAHSITVPIDGQYLGQILDQLIPIVENDDNMKHICKCVISYYRTKKAIIDVDKELSAVKMVLDSTSLFALAGINFDDLEVQIDETGDEESIE